MATKKPSKYKAIKSEYNGKIFDSKKEMRYAVTLDRLKNAIKPSERVLEYKTQVKYPVEVKGAKICTYILDFEVHYCDGRVEHVDIKGYRGGMAYSMFRIKKKLVEALYSIAILEK